MRALGDPFFDPVSEFSGSGSDDALDKELNEKSVVIAAQAAAGLNRGGMTRAAFSMNDLTALEPGKGHVGGSKDNKGKLSRKNSRSKNSYKAMKPLDEHKPMKQEDLTLGQGLSNPFDYPPHCAPLGNIFQDSPQMMQQPQWDPKYTPMYPPGSSGDPLHHPHVDPFDPQQQQQMPGSHGMPQQQLYAGAGSSGGQSGANRRMSGQALRRVASSPNIASQREPISAMGNSDSHNPVNKDDGQIRIGTLTLEERRARILRYRQKRHERNFRKRIKYNCRKTLADSRPRIRGRFARNDEIQEMLKQKGKAGGGEEQPGQDGSSSAKKSQGEGKAKGGTKENGPSRARK